MAQPTWITPAGSLGVIPEGVFYQQTLDSVVAPIGDPVAVTATTAVTNLITCASTTGVLVGQVVRFQGTSFGGLLENINYYVLSVPSSTTFTVSSSLDSTTPVTLITATGLLSALFYQRVYYQVIAGTLPAGIQCSTTGLITGVPQAVTSLQGVPVEVSEDVTSKFVVRAYTLTTLGLVDRIADRTFTLTITGNDVPQFTTPAGLVATYYDGDLADFQIGYTGTDPNETLVIRKVGGEFPLGTSITSTGLITGYIQPAPNEDDPVGYDLSPSGTPPYDFVVSAISKNYQFTLEITDGKSSNIRTFSIFVYNRDDLTADNTTITADTTYVTADETTERAPFLLNANPSNLGTARSDNYYAYRFIGQDYDSDEVEYIIAVNQGVSLPPGITLDRYTGWYYGFIPDQGVTEIEYSFNIQVRARSLLCTATQSGTNLITCDTALRGDIYVGAQITFEGTTFGGITAGEVYYVRTLNSNNIQFSISTSIGGSALTLSTATGEMLGVPEDIPSSELYPFTLTVIGQIDQEVTWITDADLGSIENGSVSLLKVEATNRGGRQLYYRLTSGAFNQLPQGLELLSSGEIAGRVSFNTFSIDLGETTFDATQSVIGGIEETTFDLTFVFSVNAYAIDPLQIIYQLDSITVVNGGQDYGTGNTAPQIAISVPLGAGAEQAEAGDVTVDGFTGEILSVDVADPGAGYGSTATVTITQAFSGTGAELAAVMVQSGFKEIVSVNKQFTIKLIRAYNKPYQNLFVLAMPPQNDRALLNSLLTNETIFPPEYIYRPDDSNFGLSTRVKYQHAFGLAPDTFDTYVSSLYLNHYWKNLVLGEIQTAQALDSDGNVIYEVVYSKIIDNLVNDAGESVSKIVTVPYPVLLDDSSVVNSVYPNSLVNMRDQVIDTVGQISTQLPLWMTSKQTNGRVLGFTPAWVIAYTNPGRSDQIAYYMSTYFGTQLNRIDFKVDRYELDSTLSRNWDATQQNWTPDPSLTTFDRINTTGYTDLGLIQAATELAFVDVNNRTVEYINALGGLDGQTWIAVPGQTAPTGTKVTIRDGSKIVFVKQENYNDLMDISSAWSDFLEPYDSVGFDSGTTLGGVDTFDYGPEIPGGFQVNCTETSATDDYITCENTLNMNIDNKIWFTGTTFGGIEPETGLGLTKVYYVSDIDNLLCGITTASTSRITLRSGYNTTGLTIGDTVWFSAVTVSNTATRTEAVGDYITVDSITDMVVGMQIVFTGTTFGGIVSGTTYYITSIDSGAKKITISTTQSGSTFALTDAFGSVEFVAGGMFGNISDVLATGLSKPYYIADINSSSQFQITDEEGGAPIPLINAAGVISMNLNRFQVTETAGGTTPFALTTATGSMVVNYNNARMSIYTITINPLDGTLQLTQTTQTVTNDYVTSTQGQKYAGGTYLYRPGTPQNSLLRINWQPLITATTVVSSETTFDVGSLQFIEPVDMYTTTDQYDKYLVFPKTNILA